MRVVTDGMLTSDPWKKRGACVGQPSELFFPETAGAHAHDAGKAICATCPVRTTCLTVALANRERWGVWGGTSPRDREKLLKLRRSETVAANAQKGPING